MRLVICAICRRSFDLDHPTHRVYLASSLKNLRHKQLGNVEICSSCFNRDYDDFRRSRSATRIEGDNPPEGVASIDSFF